MTNPDNEPEQPPLLRVINPDTTPEEVAAIVAVLSALGAPTTPAAPGEGIPPEWPGLTGVRNAHQVRPRSWRASALPR